MHMTAAIERIEDLSGEQPVRGYLHKASESNGVLVLTHGAGSNCNAPLLVKLADAITAAGISVLRCDLPFRQQRPHGPPMRTANEDQQGLRCAVELMKQRFGFPPHAARRGGATNEFGHTARESDGTTKDSSDAARNGDTNEPRVFLGGHSYGGRMASMLLADAPTVADALLLLSYPLHPPKKPEQKRTAHFPSLRTPTVFVHGNKDEFATKQELLEAMDLIPATTELVEINGGHSLSTKEADVKRMVESFLEFVRG
jgi:predicted alpha/beta-hydrolase family hydrolase